VAGAEEALIADAFSTRPPSGSTSTTVRPCSASWSAAGAAARCGASTGATLRISALVEELGRHWLLHEAAVMRAAPGRQAPVISAAGEPWWQGAVIGFHVSPAAFHLEPEMKNNPFHLHRKP
jgi:hypothetical protein